MQLLMNVPFTAIHFSAYETAKKAIATEDDENLGVQLVAGGFAGGLSAACTNPLDVIKTRLQTDGLLRHRRQACMTAKVLPQNRCPYHNLPCGLSAIFLLANLLGNMCLVSHSQLATVIYVTTGAYQQWPVLGSHVHVLMPSHFDSSAGGIYRGHSEGGISSAPAWHVCTSALPRTRSGSLLGNI